MKTKTQISFAVTAKLISAFVFATRIVRSLYFLNMEFHASSHLLWLYSSVYVGTGQKPRRPVFSERGSNYILLKDFLSLLAFTADTLPTDVHPSVFITKHFSGKVYLFLKIFLVTSASNLDLSVTPPLACLYRSLVSAKLS